MKAPFHFVAYNDQQSTWLEADRRRSRAVGPLKAVSVWPIQKFVANAGILEAISANPGIFGYVYAHTEPEQIPCARMAAPQEHPKTR